MEPLAQLSGLDQPGYLLSGSDGMDAKFAKICGNEMFSMKMEIFGDMTMG